MEVFFYNVSFPKLQINSDYSNQLELLKIIFKNVNPIEKYRQKTKSQKSRNTKQKPCDTKTYI